MVYQTVNLAFARSVGRGVEELRGADDRSLFSAETATRRVREAREVLESGERMDGQERSDDGRKWFHVVRIPVYDEAGRAAGLLRMERDITEIKAYEQQLIQAQKMESIGKLAGGVAHEINTPLSIILGYALRKKLFHDLQAVLQPAVPVRLPLHLRRSPSSCPSRAGRRRPL